MNFKVIKVNRIIKTKAKNFLNNYTPKKDESILKTKEQKKDKFENIFKCTLKNKMCGGGVQ